ncbi:MAG: BamA/TamA family outer membrane protein [Gemmatimonas sp.]|nr:BamA/TamA family outer membrane protein [Gemmatimonas sp.]
MAIVSGFRPAVRGGPFLWLSVCSAVLVVGACAPQQAPTGPFPRYSEYDGDLVRSVDFSGDIRVPEDSLRAIVQTRASRCRFLFIPICLPFGLGHQEYYLDLDQLAEDVSRIQLYHRDHGFYGALVAPDVESAEEDEVAVDFVIAPGSQVILQDLTVTGVDTIIPPEGVEEITPLEAGEPFGRADFLTSADAIRRALFERGYAYADVLRNYSIDTIAGAAEAEFVVIPGPAVVVDTIIFAGNERLSDSALRRQMTFDEGELLRADELSSSQRNLYGLNMVSFASVRLAPDTLQVDQDPSEATVLVEVVEAAQYAVEAAVGFGTVDCIRGNAGWTNRNFLGGGRTLDVVGSVARVGVGDPADMGLDESVCAALGEQGLLGITTVGAEDRLDYLLSFDMQQPSLFGTQNQLALNLHSERVSEVEAYIRESTGGQVSLVRELEGSQTVISSTAQIARGRTLASPALLCVGFDTCGQQDLDLLRQSRWSNTLSLGVVRDRQTTLGVTTRGYVLRGALDWSAPAIGSDDDYLRALAEATYNFPLQPGWVLASNLRVGQFLKGILAPEEGYIPPERRFYAGGPNSVRGYSRNALGPISYIVLPESNDTVSSATGGTQMLVASTELRMPSPWLGDAVRLAAFVDAGTVTAPGADFISPEGIRITPGVGVRFLTPVGPFRLDVAYNPYQREAGRLYLVDDRIGLILAQSSYRPPAPTFWQRFRVQFALGQAY